MSEPRLSAQAACSAAHSATLCRWRRGAPGHGNPIPEAELARRIRARGRITFAEFMEVALYHQDAGYYSSAADISTRGDFVTSPVLHPAFGALMGRFVYHVWQVMGAPGKFDVMEVGPGTGALADALLQSVSQAAPALYDRLRYVILEISPGMSAAQHQLLAARHAGKVSWRSKPQALARGAITGCIISNEVADALPFHRVCIESGRLREIYVTMDGDRLTPVLGEPSTPALARYLARAGARLPEGACAEIRLAAIPWIRALGRALSRGCVVTVDHGYPAAELYGGRFPQGTLMCYSQQVRCDDPFDRVGLQDITARVDFTALSEAGAREGLVSLPLLTQRDFLLRLGMASYLGRLRQVRMSAQQRIAERRAALALLDPDGLGNCKVLIQHKGLSDGESATLGDFGPAAWPLPLPQPRPIPRWDALSPENEV